MQFLSLSRRRIRSVPPEAFTPELMARETARVKVLYSSGLLRQIWKRGDMSRRCHSLGGRQRGRSRAAIDSLPINQAGLLEILFVVPWRPIPALATEADS